MSRYGTNDEVFKDKRRSPIPENIPKDKDIMFNGRKWRRYDIYLMRDQIMYDIDAVTGMVARARKQNNVVDDDLSTDSADGFRPMFTRWIDKYVAQAKSRMSAFLLERFTQTAINGMKDGEIHIELFMPDYWQEGNLDRLQNAVHDYIVNSVLGEYFENTLTSKDPVTMDKKESALTAYADIKKYICAVKPGMVHKPIQPFG